MRARTVRRLLGVAAATGFAALAFHLGASKPMRSAFVPQLCSLRLEAGLQCEMVSVETNHVDLVWRLPAGQALVAYDLYLARTLTPLDWAYWTTTLLPPGAETSTNRLDFALMPSGASNCLFAVAIANEDVDADGLRNRTETAMGTDPLSADTDGDGFPDGEEVGVVTVADAFLWFDLSDGADGVIRTTEVTGIAGNLFNVGGVYEVFGVTCDHFKFDKFGRVIMSHGLDDVGGDYGQFSGESIRTSPLTEGAPDVVPFNAPLCARSAWNSARRMGLVVTNGVTYAVMQAVNLGVELEGTQDPAGLVSYEVIVPLGSTNEVYVSYLSLDDCFRTNAFEVGLQFPSARSAADTNEYYTLMLPDDVVLSDRTTVRFSPGLNLDPLACDVKLQSAEERAEIDAAVGHGLTNGLYELNAVIGDGVPRLLTISVGGTSFAVTNSCSLSFLLEKGVEYPISVSPGSFTNISWTAADDIGGGGLTSGVNSGILDGRWTSDAGALVLMPPTAMFGGIVIWLPKLWVTPRNWQPSSQLPSETFTAVVTDISERIVPQYRWHSSDPSAISLSSPTHVSTRATVRDDSLTSNERPSLSLTVGFAGTDKVLASNYVYRDADNDTDADGGMTITIDMPNTLFANDDDDDGDGEVDYGQFDCGDAEVVRVAVRLGSDSPQSGTLALDSTEGFCGDVYAEDGRIIPEDYVWELHDVTVGTLVIYLNPVASSGSYLGSHLRFRWTPDDGGPEVTATYRFTVVEPVLEPVCNEWKTVDVGSGDEELVVNPCALVSAQPACFRVGVDPSSYPDELIEWTATAGKCITYSGGNRHGREIVAFGRDSGDFTLQVQIGDAPEDLRPKMRLRTVTNVTVNVRAWIIADGTNTLSVTEGFVRDQLAMANKIYRQVGVSFNLIEPIVVTNIPDAVEIYTGDGHDGHWTSSQLVNLMSGTDGLECYFVKKIHDAGSKSVIGLNRAGGTIISASADQITMAHEFGHAMGMRDIYYEDNEYNRLPFTYTKASAFTGDWNGGCNGSGMGGTRYYECGTWHRDIINRMLMCGTSYEGVQNADITFGSVEGFNAGDEDELVATGFSYAYQMLFAGEVKHQ